ncbi:MAG: radical SAM protein [Chitinivibrionales bacterium]
MHQKNFAWIATWKITRRCNLYCVYCDHASMRKATHRENIDYQKVIETLHGYSPKILNISGGEPSLVENLAGILSEIKKRWDPFIRIVHNGTGPEKLLKSFPYIDRLVISMDGPDPINKANRGISGPSVLTKLKAVLPEAKARNVEVGINCVVTIANLKSMREFADQVKTVSGSLILSFTPVMPPDGSLSILREESLVREFFATYEDLKKRGYSVMNAFDGITRFNNFKSIQCFNQYFNIRVSPEGQVLTCAMNTNLNSQHFIYYFRKLLSKNGIKKAFYRIKQKLINSMNDSIDFSCTTVCTCENWLDLIFLGISSDSIPKYARGLRGRMTEEDYRNAEAFVKRYINPEFDINKLKRLVDYPEL